MALFAAEQATIFTSVLFLLARASVPSPLPSFPPADVFFGFTFVPDQDNL